VVTGVKITLTNPTTNQSYNRADQRCRLLLHSPGAAGPYQVVAEKTGFKKATLELTVLTGRRSTADLQLEVGQVTESVEVSGVAPLLETSTAA